MAMASDDPPIEERLLLLEQLFEVSLFSRWQIEDLGFVNVV